MVNHYDDDDDVALAHISINALHIYYYYCFKLFCTRFEILLRMQETSCNLCPAFHR